MTDQTTTAITNIETALAELRDGKTTVEELGSYIGGMWQDAIDRDDQTAVGYYEAAWGLANALGESNDRAVALIHQTAAERDAVVAQRDEVTTAYTDYKQAVDSLNFEHPAVGGTLRRIHQKAKAEGYETGVEEGYEMAYDGYDPAEMATSFFMDELGIDEPEAIIMTGLINQSYGSALPKEFYDRVRDALLAFVEEAAQINPGIRE